MTVSEQVPNLTVAQLPGTVRAWDNGPLHVQHNDPGRAGKRNRGPEPDKEAPMGTSYSSGVGGQESDSGPAPCDLYRFYDSSGTLLYVGISLHAAVRSSQHRRDKPWWPQAARMEIEHLPTRDAALMAERRAIWHERPLHNVVNANDQPVAPFTLPPEAESWGSDTGFASYGQHRPAREQVIVPKCGHCGRKHKHGVLAHELERGWMDRYPHCSGLFAVDSVPWQRIYFPAKEAR